MIDIAYCDNAEFYKNIRISRAGHIFASKGREIFRPAGREDYLLFYVAQGSECFFIDGRQVRAMADSFILFAPGEAQHHITDADGISEFYYVHFECRDAEISTLFPFDTSTVYECKTAESLTPHFQEILSELQLEQNYSHEIAVTRLTELFLRIYRSLSEAKTSLSSMQIRAVHKIIHKINTSWMENLALDDYARELCLSKYHLSHIFKKYTGLSPIAYRNRLRLRYAKGMLEKTDMPIAEIAENVGFAGQQYFCEAFKEGFGISPSEYRKKYFLLETNKGD